MEETRVERDFAEEVRALYEQEPDLKGGALPQAVIDACIGGKPLTEAYRDHKEQSAKEAAAPKAPIKSVTAGGSVKTQPEDAFLRGFNAAW